MEFKDTFVRIDGVLWIKCLGIYSYAAHCPIDRMKLSLPLGSSSRRLLCPECNQSYTLPRAYGVQDNFVKDKLIAKSLQALKVIDFDNEAIPLAESKEKDETHFVIAKLVKTKVGKRLVIYAGEKGAADKTQIFIEPEIKRLAFDQNNIHPSDVFVKLEAQFKDGQKQTMENI